MEKEEILIWTFSILGGLVTFITGGGLAKLIKSIKSKGKKVSIKEIGKELKKNIKSIKRIKKTLDKEIKK